MGNNESYLIKGYYYLTLKRNKFQRELYNTSNKYYINPTPIIKVGNFTKIEVDKINLYLINCFSEFLAILSKCSILVKKIKRLKLMFFDNVSTYKNTYLV